MFATDRVLTSNNSWFDTANHGTPNTPPSSYRGAALLNVGEEKETIEEQMGKEKTKEEGGDGGMRGDENVKEAMGEKRQRGGARRGMDGRRRGAGREGDGRGKKQIRVIEGSRRGNNEGRGGENKKRIGWRMRAEEARRKNEREQ